jgi:hypothetical protein
MKSAKNGWKYAVFVLGVLLMAALVMDFNSRMADLSRLTDEREVVRARATGLSQTKAALEADIEYATSEAAVVEWAHVDGHMVQPGEVPVVPLAPEQVTPIPTPRPVVTQAPMSNWERWLSLFTGPSRR